MQTKQLTIGTKSQANRLLVDSLFNPTNGKTLTKERYDLGKYDAKKSYTGRVVEVAEHVQAIWMELRKDSDGPYKAAFCLSSR